MFPNSTTEDLKWYKIEARRLKQDELYELYTNTGDNILYVNKNVAQMILINRTHGVDVYFTAYADKEDFINKFDQDVEPVKNTHPLTSWVLKNSPSSASQLITESKTDEIKTLELNFEMNESLLSKIISKMESDGSNRLIAITIAPDFYQDYDDTKDHEKQVNYFCRPIELQGVKEETIIIDKFSQLSKIDYSCQSERCSVQSAVDGILHAKIKYRGKNSITLVGENLKFILEH